MFCFCSCGALFGCQGIVQGLDAEPNIAGNYCLAIASLAETAYDRADAIEGEEPTTYCLSPIFELLVEKLLLATERADASSAHLRSSAYEAVMELVKNSPTDCYPTVQKILVVIMSRVQLVRAIAFALVAPVFCKVVLKLISKVLPWFKICFLCHAE